MHLKILSCDIFRDELAEAAKGSPHTLDILNIEIEKCHEKPKQGHLVVQAAIDDAVGSGFDALLLGYGLCGRLMVGIEARDIPLVIPRTHDCLGVLFGSSKKYMDFFLSHPGTYYLSGGWITHAGKSGGELASQMQLGEISFEYAELVEQYGEDNAVYLSQVMGGWEQHYQHAALVVQPGEDAEELRKQATKLTASKGWDVEIVEGSLDLLRRWVNGEWPDEEFITVQPGQKVIESNDESILVVE